MRPLGDVQPTQQIFEFSCGSAALKAVLKHWGMDVDEPTLIDLIGVDPKTGSTAYQVETAAKKLGYQAITFEFDNVEELKPFVDNHVPVIMAIQSFKRPDQGHFVVGTKVNQATIDIMDPNVKGNWRTISKNEATRRWKFRDNVGIVVTPKSGLGELDWVRSRNRQMYDYGRGVGIAEDATCNPLLWAVGGIAATLAAVWLITR
jgi:ABC-type bacteriocin/lantibiotic exporter with double-glycine peptidase domain